LSSDQVAVALSGGVDSAVAALLLKNQGYRVSAFTLRLFPGDKSTTGIDTASNTARKLGIAHYVLDISNNFEEIVIKQFCREYSLGFTPNPCVVCNLKIKFGILLDHIQQMGIQFLATGHYVRKLSVPGGGFELHKALDSSKDQSYFLYRLTRQKLAGILFPLGNLTKIRVKRLACEANLPVPHDNESQDLCFLPRGDYRPMVSSRCPALPGWFVDQQGNFIGRHQGLHCYTIGQRQGLKLGTHQKLYVLGMDSKSNNIILGPSSGLLRHELMAGQISWVSGQFPATGTSISARIRSRAPEAPAQLVVSDREVKVKFCRPVKSVSPGQSIVFYTGNLLLGGGIILA